MLLPALLLLGVTAYLLARRVEARLVLVGAGLAMALAAGRPLAAADAFTRGMVAPMVAPICAALGFAGVLGATGCSAHLVYLLLAPVRRARALALPGGILAAYLVNVAVPSQTSAAAALGPVLVPLLLAAGFAPEVAGAALLLGASFGGDLVNPGAQDVQTLAGTAAAAGLPLAAAAVSARVVPATLAGVLVAAAAFAWLHRRPDGPEVVLPTGAPAGAEGFRFSPFKAIVPLVPVLLLLLAYGGFSPLAWLVAAPAGDPLAGALPVVRAMLLGSLLALAAAGREAAAAAGRFFTGMGEAYGGIISLTLSAQVFGAGLAAIGFSQALVTALGGSAAAGALLAVGLPWLLAALSGSGSGPVQVFGQSFLVHLGAEQDPARLAALACLGGAFGRTLSPVAAVTLYCSGLVGAPPAALVRRVLPALLAGAFAALLIAARPAPPAPAAFPDFRPAGMLWYPRLLGAVRPSVLPVPQRRGEPLDAVSPRAANRHHHVQREGPAAHGAGRVHPPQPGHSL